MLYREIIVYCENRVENIAGNLKRVFNVKDCRNNFASKYVFLREVTTVIQSVKHYATKTCVLGEGEIFSFAPHSLYF